MHELRNSEAPTQTETTPVQSIIDSSGEFTVAGSSTIYPIANATASCFISNGFKGKITIESTGSGAGLASLCSNKAQIASVSKKITLTYERRRGCNPEELVKIPFAKDVVTFFVSNNNI